MATLKSAMSPDAYAVLNEDPSILAYRSQSVLRKVMAQDRQRGERDLRAMRNTIAQLSVKMDVSDDEFDALVDVLDAHSDGIKRGFKWWGEPMMLARLLRQDKYEPAPKPLRPSPVSIPCPEPLSRTSAQNQSPQRRSKRIRLYRLYPQPQPETRMHARAVLGFIQQECPHFIGGYVPCADLAKFYERDLCGLNNWQPYHWTANPRQLGTLTHKRTLRQRGQRFVGYQVPRP